ncbi:hypothetical protein GMAR_ORF43 [Golden Marseillevirus]|uniref:hypothetical protein n=1 Tax=Golden Marseillevirus TaxID=1720526 RepID=UPI000877AB68|nr:hypothetical protein GMAR_ORF43 [Golden Marseillevirus]ALX27418.1 hypothetical protein GMAR_ORF43 [Golden Marseillevirus]
MDLPEEIIFSIALRLPFESVISLFLAHPKHGELDCEYFWRCYSRLRKHGRRPDGLSRKEWAKRMETKVKVVIPDGKVVVATDSIKGLKKSLSLVTNYPPHLIFIKDAKDSDHAPKSIEKKLFLRYELWTTLQYIAK